MIGRNTAHPESQFPLVSYSFLGTYCTEVHVHRKPLHFHQQKLRSTQQPVHVVMEFSRNTAGYLLWDKPRRWSQPSMWTTLQAGPFSAGVGCIRHISVCVLLMQPRVKEKGLTHQEFPIVKTVEAWGLRGYISYVCAKFTTWTLQSLWASMPITKYKN